MSASVLTEEELYLAELTPAEINSRIAKDALNQSKNVIFSVPVRTDIGSNQDVTMLGFVAKNITNAVSTLHSVSGDNEPTALQYFVITSEKLDPNEPGQIEIHLINVKLIHNGSTQIINFKDYQSHKLTDLSAINSDDDKKRVSAFTFIDQVQKYRFRTLENLHITIYLLINLLLVYYQLNLPVTGYDLIQLNVDAATKKYQNQCVLLSDEDEDMQVEEEEEGEVDPEVLEQQKRLKEEMNEAVKQITDRSENDSIAYVTQQMHQTLKDKNDTLLSTLISMESNQNKEIQQLQSTLQSASKEILNLQEYLAANTLELMKMKNALRNITIENENVTIRKQNQDKLSTQLTELLNRLTVDEKAKDILTNINSYLFKAWEESTKYGVLYMKEGKKKMEIQRFNDTNQEKGTLYQMIELTRQLQDLYQLKDEVVDNVHLGDMKVVQDRCKEFYNLSETYFKNLFDGLRQHLLELAGTSEPLEKKVQSMLLLSPLFLLIKDYNEVQYNELKTFVVDTLTSQFKTELETLSKQYLTNLIHVDGKVKGKVLNLPPSQVGNHAFEKQDLEEKWKCEEVMDQPNKYTANMAFHKMLITCIQLMNTIQFFIYSITIKDDQQQKTMDHQLVEPALTKIFNPFMTVMKGFVENDYVTPFLYLTWIEEVQYLISRQDLFYKEGIILIHLKSLSDDIINLYTSFFNNLMTSLKSYTINIHRMGVFQPALTAPSFMDRIHYAYQLGQKRITELETTLNQYPYMNSILSSSYTEEYKAIHYTIADYHDNLYCNGECLKVLVDYMKELSDCIQRNSLTDEKYTQIFKMQNYYYLYHTLTPRHIQGLDEQLKQYDIEYMNSRSKYVIWVLECALPQYFELYHVIVNLLDTKSVQELPHHISKSHFIHTFTIKNLKSILKKLNKRVHKHVSKESGLFATVWEKIIESFENYNRQIQCWAKDGYNGAVIAPNPDEIRKAMSEFQ